MKSGRQRPLKAQSLGRRLGRRCRAAAVLVRLELPPERCRPVSPPGVPIIGSVNPGIDDVIFRMARHEPCLPAQIGPDLWVAQIRHPILHRPQSLRAQSPAPRRHALLGGAGFRLSRRGGHASSVTCYARNFNLMRSTKKIIRGRYRTALNRTLYLASEFEKEGVILSRSQVDQIVSRLREHHSHIELVSE